MAAGAAAAGAAGLDPRHRALADHRRTLDHRDAAAGRLVEPARESPAGADRGAAAGDAIAGAAWFGAVGFDGGCTALWYPFGPDAAAAGRTGGDFRRRRHRRGAVRHAVSRSIDVAGGSPGPGDRAGAARLRGGPPDRG